MSGERLAYIVSNELGIYSEACSDKLTADVVSAVTMAWIATIHSPLPVDLGCVGVYLTRIEYVLEGNHLKDVDRAKLILAEMTLGMDYQIDEMTPAQIHAALLLVKKSLENIWENYE